MLLTNTLQSPTYFMNKMQFLEYFKNKIQNPEYINYNFYSSIKLENNN